MRAQRCVSPVQAVMGVMDGKIRKSPLKSDGADQVLLYLERLQHLVPQCPKDRPVTKLELVPHLRGRDGVRGELVSGAAADCRLRAVRRRERRRRGSSSDRSCREGRLGWRRR
ncbi:uncharacterized protein LOC119596104, partial [Penaeus monodon]|uniref:uncharacterized protein LOC119596104 n=1 Tax=Penaeus monodon TaxID=6687 RepID=UPI0018A6E968